MVQRRVRGGLIAASDVSRAFAEFRAPFTGGALHLPLYDAAGALAASLARDPLLKFSAADAIRLALAATAGHALVTFDQRLADAAKARGYFFEIP